MKQQFQNQSYSEAIAVLCVGIGFGGCLYQIVFDLVAPHLTKIY